jgi:hypothetical protein
MSEQCHLDQLLLRRMSVAQCMQLVFLGSPVTPGDDALQKVGEISERLDAVELAALDQGIRSPNGEPRRRSQRITNPPRWSPV